MTSRSTAQTLTLAEAADRLGVIAYRRVAELAASGELTAVEVTSGGAPGLRVTLDSVLAYLARRDRQAVMGDGR